MKKIKVSILALSVLVGGAVFASAADKTITASTSDVVITNVAPLLWVDIFDSLPSSPFTSNNVDQANSIVFVNTDMSGKIDGVVNLIKNWTTGGTNPTFIAQSSMFGSVKGSVKASKMAQPTTQMTIKANGYTAPTTNLLLINNQQVNAGMSTLNVNFSSKNPALPVNTNNPNFAAILGTSKIQFKSGIAAVNPSTKSFSETAVLYVYQNIVRQLDCRAVVYGNKLGVIEWGTTDAWGEGSINSKGAFNVTLKGGGGGSSSLQLKGQVAALSYITEGATNQITTISTVTEKGKIQGQAVEGQGYWARFTSWD
jgi:hypothetical protein